MRDLASVGWGGCGGLGFGLVRNHVWTEKLCLIITIVQPGDGQKFVAETCSCALRIVNSIPPNT